MKRFIEGQLIVVLLVVVFVLGLMIGRHGDGSRAWVIDDPGTGCEYLTGTFGIGLVPRLDRNGEHVCRAEKGAE